MGFFGFVFAKTLYPGYRDRVQQKMFTINGIHYKRSKGTIALKLILILFSM